MFVFRHQCVFVPCLLTYFLPMVQQLQPKQFVLSQVAGPQAAQFLNGQAAQQRGQQTGSF